VLHFDKAGVIGESFISTFNQYVEKYLAERCYGAGRHSAV